MRHRMTHLPGMTSRTRKLLAAALVLPAALAVAAVHRCDLTAHPVGPAALGTSPPEVSLASLADVPGPVEVETVVGADWVVPLSGLLNLDHPRAKAAHLTERDEPIQVPFHAIHHPTRGTFLVDTGVERALRDDPERAAVRGLVARVMHLETMRFREDTRTWLEKQPSPPAGVFLTHLHLDHVSGLRDVPASTPVYVGAGETAGHGWENVFLKPVVDAALEGKPPLSEWRFSTDVSGSFEGVADVFGDGTVWALWVPGHTPGSTAFLARTPRGGVLLTGDACHTRWGWENEVEPGSFSADRPRSAVSLSRLKRFVERHPATEVRVGHQPMGDEPPVARSASMR
jgi:N-acyl homoserine lactone hydrolase